MPNHVGDDRAPLAGLEPALEPFAAAAGEHLFRQNDAADGIHIVGKGRVAIQGRTLADGLVNLAEVGPGEIVGEFALIDDARRSAGALALEPTTGWRLARDRFERLVFMGDTAAADLGRYVRRLACRRTRATLAALGEAGSPPVEVREGASESKAGRRSLDGLADMLAALHQFSGFKPDEIAEVMARVSALDAPRAAVLVSPGDAPTALFIVLRGAVRTGLVRDGGVEQLLIHGPGKLVGAVPALDGEPFATRLDVREDAILLSLPCETLRAWEADPPQAAIRLFDLVGRQVTADLRALSRQQGRRRSLAALNAGERVHV